MTAPVPDVNVSPRTVGAALLAIGEMVKRSDGREFRPEDLREPLRVLCSAARDESLQAETVLIELKRVIDCSSQSDTMSRAKRADVRAHIVALAIDLYYSDLKPNRHDSQP
jgi:hypothetical protein